MRILRRLTGLIRLAGDVAQLGSRRIDRVKIFATALAMPLKRRLPGLADRTATLRLKYLDREVPFAIGDRSELIVLNDVLCRQQYLRPRVTDPRVIVDLGSHVGASVLFFHLRYPSARIYGCEADPATFRKLKANVGNLPGVEVFNIAAAGFDGHAHVRRRDESWASSVTASESSHGIEVPAETLATMMARLEIEHIDLLKLDVEGAELEVLGALEDLPRRVSVVVGEFHRWAQRPLAELYATLEDFQVQTREETNDFLFEGVSRYARR